MPEGWTYHSADGRVAVSITGPLDLESAPMFRDVLVAALAGSGDVTVDLRGCDFVDSVGVSVIVVALQRADDEDRALRFRLGGAAERVLRTSGLLDHIDIVEP
jgi:anti-anti-sigma factor